MTEQAQDGISIDDADRTHCEVWNQVMDDHRSVPNFNLGEFSEHQGRRYFVDRPDDLSADLEGRN